MDENQQVRATEDLRSVVKRLSRFGVTYQKISGTVVGSDGWSDNALKQFVHRETRPRVTPRVRALAHSVLEIIDSNSDFSSLLTDGERKRLESLNDLSKRNYSLDALRSEIGNRFSELKRTGPAAKLPRQLAFVRFGRDEAKMIVILVNILKAPSGYFFTMKITGSEARRRVVVGDVTFTLNNTYFSGIAYSVNEFLNDSEFHGLDAFDLHGLSLITSENEVGIESFVVSNMDLSYSIVPASFYGLDGLGRPISGNGALIAKDRYEALGILDYVSSSVNCSKQNEDLKFVLDLCSGQTLVPPEHAAYSVQKAVLERFSKHHSV